MGIELTIASGLFWRADGKRGGGVGIMLNLIVDAKKEKKI